MPSVSIEFTEQEAQAAVALWVLATKMPNAGLEHVEACAALCGKIRAAGSAGTGNAPADAAGTSGD